MAVERIARSVEGDVLRQRDRQIFFRHRHDAAFLAVDDRDRAAPITLARNAPVAQAVIDLALANASLLRLIDGRINCNLQVGHKSWTVWNRTLINKITPSFLIFQMLPYFQ